MKIDYLHDYFLLFVRYPSSSYVGGSFSLREQLAVSGNIFGCHKRMRQEGGDDKSIQWGKAWDAAKHLTLCRIAPRIKNYPAWNVISAEVERPCFICIKSPSWVLAPDMQKENFSSLYSHSGCTLEKNNIADDRYKVLYFKYIQKILNLSFQLVEPLHESQEERFSQFGDGLQRSCDQRNFKS